MRIHNHSNHLIRQTMRTALVLIASLTAFATATAQTSIVKAQPGITADGAVYYLPKTQLRIALLVERTTFTPGEFQPYADRYLHLKDTGSEPQTTYRLAGVRMDAVGIADTSKCFSVKLKGKSVGSNIILSDEGILLAVNTDAPQTTAFVPFRPAPKPKAENPRKYFTAEMLAAGSRAKTAELIAQTISELHESRQQLISGQADNLPKDGEQLRLMLDNLERADDALTALFTGTTVSDTTEHVLYFTPEKETERQVLFRLSQRLGLVDADDLAGAPYYITINDLHRTPKAEEPLPDGSKDGGIYVNVPGKIRVTLRSGTETITSEELYAAQFGFLDLLGGQLFRRFTTHLTLHPATGSVDKLHADMPEKK
ncbi:MAG: DUF4831 family protein [Prevotella sp.]|nr:DUF4831 family protein [Prevotella sp.]